MFKKILGLNKIILCLIVIISSIILSGCNDRITDVNNRELSMENSYDGIIIEIIQPSVFSSDDETSIKGFVLHSEDLQNLRSELMKNGATRVTLMNKVGEEYIELTSLDEFQVNEKGNKVKIIATGDHDKLKAYTLKEKGTHLADLRTLCDTFEINIKSYTEGL